MILRITTSSAIALLWSSITPAFSGPFDIMVGCWEGKGAIYNTDGVSQGGPVCSRGTTYWKTRPTLMHFHEEQLLCSKDVPQDTTLKKVMTALNVLDYDLNVNNSSIKGSCSNCGGSGANISVIGTAVPTDRFFFHLNFQNSGNDGNWYNDHYFTGRDTRHILGSFESAAQLGETAFVASQTLKRVRCPKDAKSGG
jgi:hypothetical protein